LSQPSDILYNEYRAKSRWKEPPVHAPNNDKRAFAIENSYMPVVLEDSEKPSKASHNSERLETAPACPKSKDLNVYLVTSITILRIQPCHFTTSLRFHKISYL
jgi:hypothetical protein